MLRWRARSTSVNAIGGGSRPADAGPRPFPDTPWQLAQVSWYSSLPRSRSGALEGESYQLMTFLHDAWGPTANYAECSNIDKENGCKVEVGDLCLRCVDATDPVLICD